MQNKPIETVPEVGDVRRNTPDQVKIDKHFSHSGRSMAWIYCSAVLLTLALFYFYVVVLFDVIGAMAHYKTWLSESMEEKDVGKLLLLGVFLALLLAHLIQAAVWGLFLRFTRLLPSITEASYFSGASITTLGYGDI